MIRVLIVDDEKPARDELRALLEGRSDVRVVAEASSARGALEAVGREKPDVVLLDIQMPGRTGLQIASDLQAAGAAIVFVTAHDEHAVEAFEKEAVDYVLKPVRRERLLRALERAQGRRLDLGRLERLLGGAGPLRIVGTRRGEDARHVLDPSDIDYFWSEGEACFCRASRETYGVRETLQELEARLEGRGFMRVHKSFLVNLENVVEIVPWFAGGLRLKFVGESEPTVTVSRRHAAELKRRLGWK